MASNFSSSLRATPGYYSPRSTTAYTPPKFTMPTLPQLPAIDDARAPNAAMRTWLGQQLGQLPGVLNPRLTGIRADAQQALAGYGGWKFREDDPNTPEREDLQLDFQSGGPMGEKEKQAVQAERINANRRGDLYSSNTNQNIGSALQRLSLEAQQVANQYAKAILDEQTSYANQVSQITGQWVSLYGQDSQYLMENPPTPPPPPDPYAGWGVRAADNAPIVWKGKNWPNLSQLQQQHPGENLGVRQAGDGTYVVVIGTGNAKNPNQFDSPYVWGKPGNTKKAGK